MIVENRKARHNYEIVKKYVAGIVLKGSEVKSLRAGKADIGDSYCYVSLCSDELWMKGAHISRHSSDTFTNHEELRERKLLLTKKEIRAVREMAEQKGFTIIPLKIFTSSTNLIKVEIGVCRGKKDYDKRESIKERDIKRELDSTLKTY